MKIQEKTEQKVFSYMAEHNMIAPGDSIVLGVSGGADSVCLLFLLAEFVKQMPLSLQVVHVNHGIRQQAAEDAAYVERLCEQLGIPFFLKEVDIPKLAAQEKISEEALGRRVRYEAFEEIGTDKIAVAHNANDNAETMLFHLFRGTGLKGLCGIAPVRDNIIRPILCLERWEIEEYLKERQILWCEDYTNGEDAYTRNRIRHHILPYAEQEIVGGVVGHINQTAEILRETEAFLEQQTREAMEKLCRRYLKAADRPMKITSGRENRTEQPNADYEVEVQCTDFQALSPVLQKRILLSLAKELSPTGKDISLVHVQDMLSLFDREGNRDIHLPFGIVAKRRYEKVYIEREVNTEDCRSETAGNSLLPTFTFTRISPEKGAKPPTNQYTKWLDYDKIEGYQFRYRQEGDYLTIADGQGGLRHKALKDYMVNEKIPKEQRDSIPVLAVGSHVVWLVGYRISEYFKVTENTKHILQVQLVSESKCNE